MKSISRIKSSHNDYHETNCQIVVSLKELRFQLREMMFQDNLFCCITMGREHPDYKKWLYLVCQKFEFISGMIYVKDCKTSLTARLKEDEYRKALFENYCDSIDETKLRMQFVYKKYEHTQKDLTDDEAKRAFKTYNSIKDLCCHMIASPPTDFTFHIDEFAYYIDYIIGLGDDMPSIEFDELGYPKNLPHCYENMATNELMKEFNAYQFRD